MPKDLRGHTVSVGDRVFSIASIPGATDPALGFAINAVNKPIGGHKVDLGMWCAITGTPDGTGYQLTPMNTINSISADCSEILKLPVFHKEKKHISKFKHKDAYYTISLTAKVANYSRDWYYVVAKIERTSVRGGRPQKQRICYIGGSDWEMIKARIEAKHRGYSLA